MHFHQSMNDFALTTRMETANSIICEVSFFIEFKTFKSYTYQFKCNQTSLVYRIFNVYTLNFLSLTQFLNIALAYVIIVQKGEAMTVKILSKLPLLDEAEYYHYLRVMKSTNFLTVEVKTKTIENVQLFCSQIKET